MRKYAAEFLGTFALTFAVIASLNAGTFTPVVAMVTLGLFVYTIGHVSGCHINPAVTLGALSIGKISMQDAIAYIIAQFAGALAALTVAREIFAISGLVPTVENTMTIGLAEGLGMMFFTFGIASVIYGKAAEQMSGFVVGGSLLLGILIASGVASNGVLNPAVAFGIGSFNLMYLVGPVIGGIIGMQLYKCMCTAK